VSLGSISGMTLIRIPHLQTGDEHLQYSISFISVMTMEMQTWWNKGDRPVIFKSREPDALVKFYVLHLNRLSTGSSSRALEHDLVVQTQSQLGHAGKIT